MNLRLRAYPGGVALVLPMLVIGAASVLRAQDGPASPVTRQAAQPADAAGEPANLPAEQGPSAGTASTAESDGANILDLDIDQLAQVPARVRTVFDTEVTTVTANQSSIGKSPAAVFVITNEMIRRSGATSVPECFRMVPGMQVAKIGSDKWAISSRGFNSEFAQKLLVLVDGRSVYTSFTAGVYWETQDLVLQDVDRIEVIRGPGATVWGANAVNGVINIITKKSGETQGALVSSGGGDQDHTVNSVRYGGQLGENARYRIYARQFDRASGYNPQGVYDAWHQERGGFRIDSENPGTDDAFTLQGNLYSGAIGETSVLPQAAFPFYGTVAEKNQLSGGNVLGRWTRIVSDDNTWSLQAYYDRMERVGVEFDFAIDTYDVEYRQFLKHSGTHTFTWGAGYRVVSDDVKGSRPLVSLTPQTLTYDQASLFGQEELPLYRDDLKLIVGSKFLYYYYTGFEYQPGARVLWEVDDRQVLWGAVSRAVRTPARAEESLAVVSALPPAPQLFSLTGGGRTLMSEDLLACELGYRKQVTDRLSIEVATFFNDYSHLINAVQTGFIPGLPGIVTAQFQNSQNAQSYGAEMNWQWDVCDKWQLRGWYSVMKLQLNGPGNLDYVGNTPRNQAYLMSSWDLPRKLELDLMSRYVENLTGADVPGYANLDARLGWRPNAAWEFSIIGQNLLEPHHLEFVGLTTIPSAVNRGVYAQVVWRH